MKTTNNTESLFYAINPATGEALPGGFREHTAAEIDAAVQEAERAFEIFRREPPQRKVALLRRIGEELEANRAALVAVCTTETALPLPRLHGELTRTINQLNLFAGLVEEGSWVGARIDRAQPQRQPAPKPDLRQWQIPLGVVCVFGASNFPFAFSVAGGDTASALAAGCPVVVKGHPAHPGTSALVGQAIDRAVQAVEMPKGVFSLIQGHSTDVGMAMVMHPLVKAVGFTGSTGGGKAIFAAASSRPEPIPVYAEMGSTNPVFILPGAIKEKSEQIAQGLVSSITLGTGQFCTNPGMVLALDSPETVRFIGEIAGTLEKNATTPGIMLTPAIQQAYNDGVLRMQQVKGVSKIAGGVSRNAPCEGIAYLMRASAATLLRHPALAEEVFGPSSLLVTAEDKAQLYQVAERLEGHLTATVHATPADLEEYGELVKILERKVGRLLFNGFPTGVEVSPAMVHGGPFPATTDSRSTSVGTGAIYRFTRPVCYQDFPENALPDALKDENPLGIWRLIDGAFTKDRVSAV